jgi:hypothetical protein
MAPSLPFFLRSSLSRKEGGVIAAHHTAMRGGKAAYLQADGIVWIDTGVPVSMNYAVRCKGQVVSFGGNNDCALFGFWFRTSSGDDGGAGSGREFMQRVFPSVRSDVYGVRAQTSNGTTGPAILFSEADPFAVHEVYAGFGTISVDGRTQTGNWASWTTSGGAKQHLFGVHQTNPVDQAQNHHSQQTATSCIRIWSATWEDANGNLVRDFVPKVVGGQAGMFDRVTQTFFGPASASSGVFSIGTGA